MRCEVLNCPIASGLPGTVLRGPWEDRTTCTFRIRDRPGEGGRTAARNSRLQRASRDGTGIEARSRGLRSTRELRAAEWSEFDLANAEWRIPGARMKMGEPHIVPLSRHAFARVSVRCRITRSTRLCGALAIRARSRLG